MAHSTPTKTAAPPETARGFQPYVPPSQSPAEFTAKAIVIGVIFGVIFGASTVYLGLRAGLTVSASIPIAVLAISVLKKLGGSTILENNIVQTIGSAGESVAGGVVFTIPALIFLAQQGAPDYFNYTQILLLSFAGGILGVLMMVPLRRALIVKEHGVLPYPEGTACAEVLVIGCDNDIDRADLRRAGECAHCVLEQRTPAETLILFRQRAAESQTAAGSGNQTEMSASHETCRRCANASRRKLERSNVAPAPDEARDKDMRASARPNSLPRS